MRLTFTWSLIATSTAATLACVRETDLVPIEVSPRVGARMAYVEALPSRAPKASAQTEADADSEGESIEEQASDGGTSAKSLATD